MYVVTPGIKIRFEYDLDVLFNQVSLETLTQALKIEKNGELMVDEYGISDDERDQFDQFISEGHIKVFAKLLKMTNGIDNSIKINLSSTSSVKQKDTVNLTGTSGRATITGAGDLHTVLFWTGGNPTDTASEFVTTYAAGYLAKGIVVTSAGNSIYFEALVAGTPFVHPVIANASGDLSGDVVYTTANVTVYDTKRISCEIKDKQGYNANYLPIIDGEIELALRNYIIKKWFAKCVLGDLAKYYDQEYIDNMKAIQRYSLQLRKPSFS